MACLSRCLTPRDTRGYAHRRLRRQRTNLLLARVHVLADRLQPSKDALPLGPIELPQERPEALDKRVLKHGLTVRFGNEEAIQTDAQRFGNLFESAETWCHLPA